MPAYKPVIIMDDSWAPWRVEQRLRRRALFAAFAGLTFGFALGYGIGAYL